MEIYTVACGNMKLDGGAMFGIIPKSLWTRQYEADENNMVSISMRSLLVVDGDRKILFDNGIGDKQDHKFFSYYYLFGDDSLDASLGKLGMGVEDITDMVLTHLHFDHCGGSVRYAGNGVGRDSAGGVGAAVGSGNSIGDDGSDGGFAGDAAAVGSGNSDAGVDRGRLETVFPNARYWVSRPQWDLAQAPNKLEGASFLEENINPIRASGQMELFDGEFVLTPNIQLRLFDGHTLGQAVALVDLGGRILVNAADLIPLAGNISMSWVCGYDTQPLVALQEKSDFLKESLANDYIYYFYHDLQTQCCTLKDTMKGVRPKESFDLCELTGILG